MASSVGVSCVDEKKKKGLLHLNFRDEKSKNVSVVQTKTNLLSVRSSLINLNKKKKFEKKRYDHNDLNDQ